MTAGPLKDYRLRPAAQRDLEAIWLFTAERWSPAQAEAYLKGLRATLDMLLGNPLIARERRDLAPGLRVHPYRSHIIIYRVESDHLDVIRIRHGSEDWISDPAEGTS